MGIKQLDMEMHLKGTWPLRLLRLIKTLSRYTEVITYCMLGAWLITAFVATVYCYAQNKRVLSAYAQHLPNNDSTQRDSASLHISQIIDGKIYGTVEVITNSEKIKMFIDQGDRYYIRYFTVNDNPMTGKWVKMTTMTNKRNHYVLTSDKEILLYELSYATKQFPFDKYYITFDPNIIVIDTAGDILCENEIPHRSVSLTLPFQLTTNATIRDDSINKLLDLETNRGGVSLSVERPTWYLWFFGGILGFLAIPVLVLFRSDIKTISFNIIALVISFMSVRSFFVGGMGAVYPIDAYFCFLILISGLIVLSKLFRMGLQRDN